MADQPLDPRLETALAALGPDDLADPPPPPPEVWDAIEAAVRAETDATMVADAPDAPASGSSPLVGTAVADAPDAPVADGPAPTALEPGAKRRGRRPSAVVLGLVAAVVLLVVAIAAVVVPSDDDEPQVAARADLNDELLTVTTGTVGDARLLDDGDELLLEVDLPDLPAAPAGVVYEVWLIDPTTEELQTLGLTDGRGTRLVVPAGIDPTQFALVDVSREPVDGEPAHSGDSIVRGLLEPIA